SQRHVLYSTALTCAFSSHLPSCASRFFFPPTATTQISTLSLHDALPILERRRGATSRSLRTLALQNSSDSPPAARARGLQRSRRDRKSTRLNSSHGSISYAVFCLKKKKIQDKRSTASERGVRLDVRAGS